MKLKSATPCWEIALVKISSVTALILWILDALGIIMLPDPIIQLINAILYIAFEFFKNSHFKVRKNFK